jgi:hypothetical protein
LLIRRATSRHAATVCSDVSGVQTNSKIFLPSAAPAKRIPMQRSAQNVTEAMSAMESAGELLAKIA